MEKRYYVIRVVGDVDPELHGPYADEKAQGHAARKIREEDDGDLHDGILWLTIHYSGTPEIGAYSGGFFVDPADGARYSDAFNALTKYFESRRIRDLPGETTLARLKDFLLNSCQLTYMGATRMVRLGNMSTSWDDLVQELDSLIKEHGPDITYPQVLALEPWPVEICPTCDMPFVQKGRGHEGCPCETTSQGEPEVSTTETATKPRLCLCIPRSELDKILSPFQGVVSGEPDTLVKLYQSGALLFKDRDHGDPPAEKDPTHKQLIPYIVIREHSTQKIYAYRRTPKGGESRLHGRRSIGVGGHIEPGDGDQIAPGLAGYYAALRREFKEEVTTPGLPLFEVLGFLNDDSDEVGSVHLGVVHLASVATATSNEEDHADDGFYTLEELLADIAHFESWSQILIRHLAKPKASA